MTRDELIAALRTAGCVFAEDEADLLLAAPALLAALLPRRLAGEPLEQVLGWAEFDGARVVVRPGVFVPRTRSELLVRLAVERLPPGAVVVDLCCGSGALGAAIARRVPGVRIHAGDLDPAAVDCARINLPGARVEVGDLWRALDPGLRGRVAVAVANAPYVPSGAVGMMPSEARDHEPRLALDGGTDGLDVHRRIADEASDWLKPGGRLLIEVSEAQRAEAVRMLRAAGLAVRAVRAPDLDALALVASRPR